MGFSPFDDPDFRYDPDSPMVQGMERPLTTLSEWLHPEVAALRADLGIPQKREIWRYQQWCPLGWQGYFFDLVGTYRIPGDPTQAKPRHDLLATSVYLSRPYAVRTNSNSSNCCMEKDLRAGPRNDRGRYTTNDSWGFNGINVPCGEAKRVE
jgi:hypothetical protein